MDFPPRPRSPVRSWPQAISDMTLSRDQAQARVQAQAQARVDQEPNRGRSESNVSDVSNSSSSFSASFSFAGGSYESGSSIPSLIAHDAQDGRGDRGRDQDQYRRPSISAGGDDGPGCTLLDADGRGELMTPPNGMGGYFDLIRRPGVDDGLAGDLKGKGKQLDGRVADEPELFTTSWNGGSVVVDDRRSSSSPGPSIRVHQPTAYPLIQVNLGPTGSQPRPPAILTDRDESRTSSTLFVPRGTGWGDPSGVYTRSGTPCTMRGAGGSTSMGRNTPIRLPSPSPGPSPGSWQNDDGLGSALRSSSSMRELTPCVAVPTPTSTTTFPDWLRSRPRSSSSASILSRTSQSTGSGSMTSLSGRIKRGMKSRLSFRDGDQVGSGSSSGSSGFNSTQGPTYVENKRTNRPLENKEKKDGPKGLMRRLMVRSKTSPLVVTTVHHHPVGHDLQGRAQTSKNVGSVQWAGKEEGTMVIVPRRQQTDLVNMPRTRRAGETGSICPAQERRANTTEVETALEGPIVHHEGLEPRSSSFENKLPREIRLLVFRALVDLHVTEHQTLMKRGKWKGIVAQQRWYGETAGRRELFRLRSVSTSWNDLAMDGQLWQDCDMHPYLDHMPPSVLIKLLWSSSSCVRKLDTYGWIGLPGASIVNALNGSGAVETSLRTLDLQGCRDLAAKDVKWLLDHSPHLHWVSLKGLTVVDSYLWKSLMQLKSLEYLDVSHCKMSFFSLISHAGMPQTTKITHFLAAGLGCTLEMDLLAGIMPNLQVLDLSHCPTLKDQDILNFVNPPSVDWEPAWRRLEITGRHRSRAGEDIAFLTEEESGQAAPVAWMNFTPRRVTRLKKLALSECTGLTDQACRYLAHAVPQLEVFEMAHADGNPGIRSAGLVAMLSTCTKIRKVDLEGAVEIDEEVLSALTPRATNVKNEVGSCLEVLSIGFADDVSLDAMLQLVRRCPRLRQLDVDNTNATDLLVKEFVRKRGHGTSLSVVDCRGVSRNVVEALESRTRPRDGWRGWQAAPLKYIDGFKAGKARDECTQAPVVQSFWTWNSVPRADRPGLTSHARHNGGALSSIEMDALDGHYDRSCVIM